MLRRHVTQLTVHPKSGGGRLSIGSEGIGRITAEGFVAKHTSRYIVTENATYTQAEGADELFEGQRTSELPSRETFPVALHCSAFGSQPLGTNASTSRPPSSRTDSRYQSRVTLNPHVPTFNESADNHCLTAGS